MQPLNNLTFGRYIHGESLLHRLDPRAKLICAVALMLGVFAVREIPEMVGYFCISVLMYPLARIRFATLFTNLRTFALLYLITFCIHFFIRPGEVLFTIPLIGVTATLEGLQAGVLFTLRIAVLVSISTLLMAVTTPQDLTDGLERLFKPLQKLGLPVSEGALMISIALRFVPILMQEAVKIQKAQTARGANLEGSWIVRLKKTIPMILPLFAGALRKADNLAVALEARGYRGGRGRTRMVILKIGRPEWLAFSLTAIFIFTLTSLN